MTVVPDAIVAASVRVARVATSPSDAPIGPVVLDQAGESWIGRVWTEWKAESRGVEVGVYVGERGEQNPTSTIDRRHVRPLCYIAIDV